MPRWFERFLDRALKVRPGEATKVGLMALYAANAIGAVVVGRTVRDTLFLSNHRKEDLPVMYILNSVAVALLSWGYSRIADRARRDKLNAYVALGWAAVMAAFFVFTRAAPESSATALYIAVEAMGALVVIQFWTFAQDVFNAREAKRLFGLIGAGGQLANVIYGFVAASISKRLGAEALLFLCSANLVACAALSWYVGRRFAPSALPAPVRGRKSGGKEPGGQAWSALATPHLVTIAAIAVLSALAVNLVDYQFKAAAEENIPDKAKLGAFFGRFYGICGALALGLQMGVTGRVLEKFGILASLLPLPIGLALGSGAALVFPSGWTASIAKGSDSIFRYTLNDASMQLLYLPVPAHQRGKAKALIDGILKPAAGVVAGLLLVLIGRRAMAVVETPGRPDPWLTLVICVLVVGWVLLLVRGKNEYVSSLLDTLQKRRLDLNSAPMNTDQATADALTGILKSGDALGILHALELLPHVRGRDFGPALAELTDHKVSSVRAAATDLLAEAGDKRFAEQVRARLADRDPWCVASALVATCAIEKEKALGVVQPFLKDPRPAIRAAAVIGLVRHAGINGILESAEELKRLMNAQQPVERELAASVLGALGVPTFYDSLLRFIDDPSPTVRRAALVAASRLKAPELVPHIIKQLSRRDTAREAAVAIASFGAGVEHAVGESLFDKTIDLHSRVMLPAVLARVGTREAGERLHAALECDEPALRAAAGRALARLSRRRSDVEVRRDVVTRAIESELGLAESLAQVQVGLNLPAIDRAAPLRVPRGHGARSLLALALVEERDRCIERAIILLQLLHPEGGLELVADNLRSDVPARRANAVEVLDNTVREDTKKRLLPLIEDRLPPRPIAERNAAGWLSELVTGRTPWIAACAAQHASELGVSDFSEPLQKGLGSPVAFVREACAAALARLAPEDAKKVLPGLEDDPSPSVRRVVTGALLLTRLAQA